VLLVPMISVTLYTLMTVSFDHVRPAPGLLSPASHRVTVPVLTRSPSSLLTTGQNCEMPRLSVDYAGLGCYTRVTGRELR
jgi:hypothetical protein